MKWFFQKKKTIKRFRSDNGAEFFNIAVNTYFLSCCVIHESSCVNTPQQNGLAERRLGYTLVSASSLSSPYALELLGRGCTD